MYILLILGRNILSEFAKLDINYIDIKSYNYRHIMDNLKSFNEMIIVSMRHVWLVLINR